MPEAQLLVVDEPDETLLDYPYAFLPNSTSKFNGIWNWGKYQVIGLTATAQGDVLEIFEEVIAKPNPVCMLEFKSEFEMVSGQSTINGTVVALEKDESIIEKIIENIDRTYTKVPRICFLD
jgi:hypothetical protein